MTLRADPDRGQVTAMWAILSLALLVLAGLIYDGGQILTARREANNLARQAARAGAQTLDETASRIGTLTLDPDAAEAAALDYLARRHATGTAIADPTQLTVTVTIVQPTPLLALAGIDQRVVTGTATAQPTQGPIP
ncbi:MAG: pilus assembly protein TadG-related protein [Acidimicrobiales bacterium]